MKGKNMKLLGKAHDAEFWREVREKDVYERFRNESLKAWEKWVSDYEPKALSYSKWKLFWETGDRSEYEREYFDRRRALEHVATLALIYPEEKKYVDKLMDLIYIICDEYTWCLPAHQGQNERNDNTRVDLFASEMGLYMSVIYTLMGDRLDPVIRDRMVVEINRRIVDTYLGCENYGWWEVGKTNWTAVCVGSVGCTLMLMRPDLMTEAMEARLLKAMQGFVDGFEDDGVCTEGCGYWSYGVGFFVQFADMIRTFTGGRVDYFKIPKMKAIATFPQKMFLSEQAAVSFADGNRELDYNFSVMHRLKSEYPEDVLIYSPDFGSFDGGCGRFIIRLMGAVWLVPEYYLDPADSTTEFEEYAANAQWLTKRTASYGFAAKAGHNAEMHNHNDVGSFILARDGRQILTDVGAGAYTRQYFSEVRYDIFEPASKSHSVPLIDGLQQSVGREFGAKDVKYEKGSFSFDMAGAYATDKLASLGREFKLYDDRIELTDTYAFNEECPVVERIVLTEEPKVDGSTVTTASCSISFDPTACELSIGGDYGTTSRKPYYYFLDFKLNAGVREFKVVIR